MYTQYQMYILVRTDVSGIYLAAGNCRGHTEIKPEPLEELEFTVRLSMYFGVLEKLLPKSISCLQRSVHVVALGAQGILCVTTLRILSRIKR